MVAVMAVARLAHSLTHEIDSMHGPIPEPRGHTVSSVGTVPLTLCFSFLTLNRPGLCRGRGRRVS